MTKPVAFVLQLGGIIFVIAGFAYHSWFAGIVGALLILGGGIGIRRRMRDK